MAGMVPFFTRLLERADKLPTLTQRGRGGLGASAECCRWYFFSQTPEPNLALISRKDFGSKVDGREIGASFYGMGTDPQPIRTRLRGISVDPNKERSRREVAALTLTHNQSKGNCPASGRVQSNRVQCDGAPTVLRLGACSWWKR